MEVRDAETEARGRLEAAARGVHADGWGREGVVRREYEGAPVLAAFVGGFGRAGEDVVPFEDVAVGWVRDDVRRRVFGYGFVFSCEAFVGGAGGHDVVWRVESAESRREMEGVGRNPVCGCRGSATVVCWPRGSRRIGNL